MLSKIKAYFSKKEIESKATGQSSTKEPQEVSGDRPISEKKYDRFGREPFAKAIAIQILSTPKNEGYVMALLGPWGGGKTSVLNMVENELSNSAYIIKFNPWFFSGTEQLIAQFFKELGAQLADKKNVLLEGIAEQIDKYSDLLGTAASLPGIKQWAPNGTAEIAKGVSDSLKSHPLKRSMSIREQREKIEALALKLDKPLVITIDDIDRLRQNEVREIMKLVRLTGDFPNITYLLSFDKKRVEAALGEDHDDGAAYLEKIIQLSFDLPQLQDQMLRKFFLSEIERAIEGLKFGPLHQDDLTNYLHLGIFQMLRTPRDVRRFAMALPAAIAMVEDEIAISDLIAIESIRVLRPEVFSKIPGAFDALTALKESESSRAGHKEVLKNLLTINGELDENLKKLLMRLFPATKAHLANTHYGPEWLKTWRTSRKIAHADVFRFYLEKNLPEGVLPARDVHRFFEILGEEKELEEALSQLDGEKYEKLLERIADYEQKFDPNSVEVAIKSLYRHANKLREQRDRDLFDLGARLALERAILRLLWRVEDKGKLIEIVKNCQQHISSFTWRQSLIGIIAKHTDKLDRPFAEENDVKNLNIQLQRDILNSTPEKLCEERELPWLFRFAAGDDPQKMEVVRKFCQEKNVFSKILKDSLKSVQAQTIGDAVVRVSYRMAWKTLTEFVGEDSLKKQVTELANATQEISDQRLLTAIETSMKYVTGELKSENHEIVPEAESISGH